MNPEEKETEEKVVKEFKTLKEYGDLRLFEHKKQVFYHFQKELVDYYYVKFSEDDEKITFYCSEYNPKKASKTCNSKLVVRKSDGYIFLEEKHTCGVTHFFFKGDPIFIPIKSGLDMTPPNWVKNEILFVEPERVNIRHLWRRNIFGKVYLSFVNGEVLECLPFTPESSKLRVRLLLSEENEILYENFASNVGILPEIICCKPVVDSEVEKLGGLKGSPPLEVVFKLPITTIEGSYDIEVSIANSVFVAKFENAMTFYKEYLDIEDQIELLEPHTFPSTSFDFCSKNFFFYGSYFFEKLMRDLCAFTDPNQPVGFITNEIRFRKISRKMKKKFDCFGFNLLIHFACRGFLDACDVLIEEGFDVNYQDHCGNTALFWANRNGHREVVNFLISKGADEKIENKAGETYDLFKDKYKEERYSSFEKERELAISNDIKIENARMLEKIENIKDSLLESGIINPTAEMKAKKEVEFQQAKNELFNFMTGKRATTKKTAVHNKKTTRPQPMKKLPTERKGFDRNEKKGSKKTVRPMNPKATMKDRGKNMLRLFKKKKNIRAGRKMKKVPIAQWKLEHILDWLEVIGLIDFKFLMMKHGKEWKELESLLEKGEDFFEEFPPRQRMLLMLNIKHLKRCVDTPKGLYAVKDHQFNILQKVSANPDFGDVTFEELENFLSYLGDELQIREKMKQTKEENRLSMEVKLILVNDQFYGEQSLRECIDFAYQKDRECVIREAINYDNQYYVGAMIGDIYLEFGPSELCFPRKIRQPMNCVCLDITEMQIEDYEEKYIEMLASTCARWNKERKHDRKTSNSYHFVEEIMKKCLLVRELVNKTMDPSMFNALEEIRKNGVIERLPLERVPIKNWINTNSMNFFRLAKSLKLMERFVFEGRRLYGNEIISIGETDPIFQKIVTDEVEKLRLLSYLTNLKNNAEKRNLMFDFYIIPVTEKIIPLFLKKNAEELEETTFHLSNVKGFITKYLSNHPKELNVKDVMIEPVVTEISFDFEQQIHGQVNSTFIHQFSYPQEKTEVFHAGIVVGPWYFEWNSSNIVIPQLIAPANLKKVTTGFQSRKVPSKFNMNTLKEKIATICTKWNGKHMYEPKKSMIGGNSLNFVDDFLLSMGLFEVHELDGGTFLDFFDNLRKNEYQELIFSPGADFVEYFKIEKNADLNKYKLEEMDDEGHLYHIKFESHAELDEFVNMLFTTANEVLDVLIGKFPSEFRLLKAFDNAFWLRLFKSQKRNEKYKPTSKIRTGCPFKTS